ncbi:ribonuclease H-like domain-containing protein [Cohnella caldifontis]|uniref:ribonuclease H-like domain-containing protein n=1 Tax=Cohnella caldifontis TaxID=3027471 RepID=UPI0023ECFAB1|nr:ribonuclease H-like domain-containing protein [Cohnella sp. YIM B05605]
MSGLKERLERLRQTARAAEASREAEAQAERDGDSGAAVAGTQPGEDRLHPGFRRLGVTEETNEAGSFLLRRIVYPLPYKHGRCGLEELFGVAPLLHPVACRQNGIRRGSRRVPADPGETPVPQAAGLLFLDTETTGLGVGAGNVPFMIGIGRYTDRAFVVEQTLIRHPGEERAMLTWLLTRFQGVTHLVTYNGRSFDWPVLANRFILNGWRRSGPEPGHLDFLHPARALWKNTLPTCRLGTVEEERLGIVRGEDVPGSLAPELYMRFLSDGNAEHLSGVYVHNEKDVLTLAALAVHFGHLLAGRLGDAVPVPDDAEERFRTGAWLEQHGRSEDAMRMYDLLAAEPEPAEDGSEIGWRLALAARYKRLGNLESALALWQQAAAFAESSRLPRIEAHLELAMYYEHKTKDYGLALRYANTALELTVRRLSAFRASSAAQEEKARLVRRIDRLKRKLDRRPVVPDTAGSEVEAIWGWRQNG